MKISYGSPSGGFVHCYEVVLTYETSTGSRRSASEFYFMLTTRQQNKVRKYAEKHLIELGYKNPQVQKVKY